jgi:hypothetical protein
VIAPPSPEERLILAELAQGAPVGVDGLVGRVSRTLYHSARAGGAWAADIGVFGTAVFESDVRAVLRAGDGRLWTITPTKRPLVAAAPSGSR